VTDEAKYARSVAASVLVGRECVVDPMSFGCLRRDVGDSAHTKKVSDFRSRQPDIAFAKCGRNGFRLRLRECLSHHSHSTLTEAHPRCPQAEHDNRFSVSTTPSSGKLCR
jgi:hypothetical protein